jgi:hypothetical protein
MDYDAKATNEVRPALRIVAERSEYDIEAEC